MAHSKQIAETADYVLDDIITELGCEPGGHKTWAKTTDEIVETIKTILIEALQTAERRGEEREREEIQTQVTKAKKWSEEKLGKLDQTSNNIHEVHEVGWRKGEMEMADIILSSIKPTSEEENEPK